MKRSAAPLQFLAAAATDTSAMSSRSSYRGGRNQWGRYFSDMPNSGGRDQQVVTGDSHFQSVREANLGIRQAGGGSINPRPRPYNQSQRLPRPPRYNPNQHFRQSPPFVQNQNHQFRQASPFHPNQPFRPPQQFRARPPKPLDYRDWEYAKTAPPPNSEKFIVLSYNILADYLAINHRSKLYFHIPRHMLDWEWRKRNILFELDLWSADILCFQEVDKFQDLEEQLKIRGYSGIWKMRTGNAVDGCAMFWRTSRFKLLYEESIEFNKLGLRDNVCQICVLELTSKHCNAHSLAQPPSSAGSNKVIVCNIHVLYNPKRGEIKLGQVRTFLDKAYAVSKTWNAPVVLCGDFNCTPKSPLYNFISEQKLDLSGVDRDKVSGQASAEIRPPRPYNLSHIPNPNPRTYSSNNSNQLADSLFDTQKQNYPDKSEENIPSINDYSQPQHTRTVLDVSYMSCKSVQFGTVDNAVCVEETKETQQDVIDSCKEGAKSTISVLIDSIEENLTVSHSESQFADGKMNEQIYKLNPTSASPAQDAYPDKNEMEQTKSSSLSSQGLPCEHSHSNIYKENKGTDFNNLAQSLKVSRLESSGNLPSQPVVNDENCDLSAPFQANISSVSTSIYHADKKLDDASRQEINNFQLESEMIGESRSTFLSALHNSEDSSDICRIGQSDLGLSQNEFASDPNDSELHSPINEVLDDFSLDPDSEAVSVDRNAYDPSLWTPMEMATATGNADSMLLEHPLKLKSTYAGMEDCSGTRDSNGEPLVTSYNRCFLGTVDYIWCSERLQTIRVLAPIPKHAMQWTPGFPTKKWGSDHIALASELAFTKDNQ
ncbi:hypothetical protein P3X46_019375 [Hevea brasiliensis]|uniref:Endonuclease/exonuclease/phosphatase domain-containing protein n=1 Tax=Hevea brasiliensis TaxID=3981 RepID=A0ABQ9LKG2_HEVBR|nr:carbon catabolite repressor protein 4 homolog 6 isoform X2 [Hevea brasiliensis]KAJ9167780.1 hypothetical protein P3X46_019375 [Hevea brasiliensis]